jgi:hypothetical protein
MSRQITFDFLPFNKSITVQLREDKNQDLCNVLWQNLPYASIETHTVVSGKNLYHEIPILSPFFVEGDDFIRRPEAPVGTVFLPDIQTVMFKYGDVSEQNSFPPIGHVVPADLPVLQEVGILCWQAVYTTKEPVVIIARRSDENVTLQDIQFNLVNPDTMSHPIFRQLIKDMNEEIERIWFTPPSEMFNVFAGKVGTRPGSYGQFLSGLMIMAGEVRAITGAAIVGGLLRSCQDPSSDLQVLKVMTRNLLLMPTEFVGYCGLPNVWKFAKVIFDEWDHLASKEEYFSVMASYATYINQLNVWVLHYFPWDIQDERFKY